MNRLTGLRSRGGVAAAIALLAACGGTIDSRQNPEKGSAASGNTSSGGEGAAQTSSGASGSSGGGTIAPIGSSSGGSSSSSSSGASSGTSGSSGGSMPGGNGAPGPDAGPKSNRGCGLGTSCIPGSDLAAPAAADGFQIVTPPGSYTVQPGQEIYPNYCAVVPSMTEFDVGRIQSWMTPGSSHDLSVYRGGMAPADGSCVLGADDIIFMASISDQIVELKMPEGVGNALQPGTQIIVSMHFVNSGTSNLQPQVKLNFFRAATYKYEAGMMVSFNTSINVPIATPSGPGTQTVNGTCTGSAGSQFFAIGTHTHAHATTADVNYVSGADDERRAHDELGVSGRGRVARHAVSHARERRLPKLQLFVFESRIEPHHRGRDRFERAVHDGRALLSGDQRRGVPVAVRPSLNEGRP